MGDDIAGAPVAVGRGYIIRPAVLEEVGGGPTGGGAIIRGGGPLGDAITAEVCWLLTRADAWLIGSAAGALLAKVGVGLCS